MAFSFDPSTIDWDDTSPPNLMIVSDAVKEVEGKLLDGDLQPPEGYPGADAIFEKMLFEEVPPELGLPCYQALVEDAFEGSEITQDEFTSMLNPILQHLGSEEEEAEESGGAGGATLLNIQDETERDDLSNFITEALDQLSDFENNLPNLISRKTDGTFLNGLFRRIHTIKGASGFFGLTQLSHISHEMENVMDKARNGGVDIDDEVVSVLVKGAAWMHQHLNDVQQSLEQADLPSEIKVDKGASDPVHYGCLVILHRPGTQIEMEEVSAEDEAPQDSII